MKDISSAIRDLIRRGLRSTDHVKVLMCLRDATTAMTAADIESATAMKPQLVAACLQELVDAGLAQHDVKSSAFTYAASAEDRMATDAMAILHSQWPDTLEMLFYNEPPRSLKAFSKAFRLRIEDKKKDT